MRKQKLIRRITASFLAMALLFSTATQVIAAPSGAPPDSTDSYEADMDAEIESDTAVGNLIKNTLSNETGKSEDGYDIIALTVEGNTASVEYDTLEDSELVVAVYAEGAEPLQMLASGHADAPKDSHTVQVTIETDSMPQYFIAKAFLLRKASHSPLCSAFVSTLYTQEMQELLSKTASDFDENRVLNLDDDDTTNYAVYSTDTEIIEEQAGKNIVQDNGDGTYTITNADSSFTSLKKGDVFSYNYEDGTILVAKISAIQVNGTTVTITEDKNADLSDVFDYVKIEETDNGANVAVDDSNLEDGVTYEGEISPQSARAVEIGGGTSKTFSFQLSQEWKNVKITGGVGLGIKTNVKIYLSLTYQYVEAKLELPLSFNVNITGECEKQIKLASLTISPVAGLYICFTPTVILRASGQIEYIAEFTTVIGFAYDSREGFLSKCAAPRMTKNELSVDASLYAGLSLVPDITVISKNILKASLNAEAGVQADGSLKGGEETSIKKHTCKHCIEGTLTAKANASVQASLAGKELNANLFKISKKISDFYYSIDNKEFALTTCPYFSYRITLKAVDEQKKPVANASIQDIRLLEYAVTDENGNAVFYLPNGTHSLSVSNDEYSGNADITVKKNAKTVTVNMTKTMPTSGTCGQNLTWELDKGTLYIRGTGEMYDYTNNGGSTAPWYSINSPITALHIDKGVTSIGALAFMGCNFESVQIPEGVTRIGEYSFWYCTKLRNIQLPAGLNTIKHGAFWECENLENIDIPDSVITLEKYAFCDCANLKTARLPENITTINEGLFYGCHGLKYIEIL